MRGDEEWVAKRSKRGVEASVVMVLNTHCCVCVSMSVFVKTTCDGVILALMGFFYSFMSVCTNSSFRVCRYKIFVTRTYSLTHLSTR